MLSPQPETLRTLPPPWRYGMAVVLGLTIGLLPKDSAICYILAVLGIFLPVSLPVAVVSAAVFSIIGPFLDAITDPVGYWLLTQPSLNSFWQTVAATPGSTWLRLNNSVVVGSLAIAGIFAIPTLLFANWCTRHIQMSLASRPTNTVPPGQAFATELE